MDRFVVLPASRFGDLIKKLAETKKVVAPVAKGHDNFAFEEIAGVEAVSLKYIPTILPPKKYFMPQQETILRYNKAGKEWTPVVESEEVVIFGMHTCDLAGVAYLNKVMSSNPQDANYLARKARLTLIGIECNEYCDEYASCRVMNNHLPNGGYDLFFTELDDFFMIHVNSAQGEKIVEESGVFIDATPAHHKALEDLRARKETIFKREVNVDKEGLISLFAQSFESQVWEDVGSRCVACGNCTAVCPTCYCFDIRDKMNLDLNTGERYRVWDSCQNEEFAKVAGGENFRETRAHRQKHRYMRKFLYPVHQHEMFACTGCGRCSRTCMAEINLKETINALVEDAR